MVLWQSLQGVLYTLHVYSERPADLHVYSVCTHCMCTARVEGVQAKQSVQTREATDSVQMYALHRAVQPGIGTALVRLCEGYGIAQPCTAATC